MAWIIPSALGRNMQWSVALVLVKQRLSAF